MPERLLGIDVGTSSLKAALFARDGSLVAERDVPYAVDYPRPGWAEQSPERWWEAAVTAVSGLLQDGGVLPSEIAAVGVDGQSWACVAVDRAGEALCPSPIWTDTRARRECREMAEAVGEEELFACCGNPIQPGYTGPKALWLKRNCPEVWRRTDKILQSNGYIVYRLTGAITQDESQGYGWPCFDNQTGRFDEALARQIGLEPSHFPAVVPCDRVVGRVTRAAAALTGLSEGTPVVAGGLDAACGTLGVGVLENGQTQEQSGQAGGMSVCMDAYAAHPHLILSRHVVPGRWLLQGGTTGGGGALRWLRERLFPARSFSELGELAQTARPGSDGVIFLPYMAGERSPLWAPEAKGAFYGLSFSVGQADMVRAVMEGVAFSLRYNLDTAGEAGVRAGVLRAAGGSAKSPVWMQIKADVTGHAIEESDSAAATARGAAMLAGRGVGLYADYREAAAAFRTGARYEPDRAAQAIYEPYYQTYRRLSEALLSVARSA